ncbi:MAG: endolytic transglycosylase MltG [Rickettsiales bacterium]|jgi:UPF0755 protein|nr:endolytic transglycosylase MltG [Rickettsiales bacterium]
MNKRLIFGLIFASSLLLCSSIIYLLKKDFSIEKDIIFEITDGRSAVSIVKDLKNQQIISSSLPYIILLKIENNLFSKIQFKSGEYLISSNDNFLSLIKKFQTHDVFLRKITFVEGTTTSESINIINKSSYLSGDISLKPREGYLFPDTYYFEKHTSKDDLIRIMQTKTNDLLNSFWDSYHKNISLKSKEEVLVMASIIEKETGKNGERGQISGVFYNRLARKMRLQSDPTVIYAITNGKYQLKRQLSKKDLKNSSKYNTYKINGLPPTPITNPGYQAIYAAFNPDKTNYLYFVSDGNGGHNFSTNLKDHNKNVTILRKIEKDIRNEKKD